MFCDEDFDDALATKTMTAKQTKCNDLGDTIHEVEVSLESDKDLYFVGLFTFVGHFICVRVYGHTDKMPVSK